MLKQKYTLDRRDPSAGAEATVLISPAAAAKADHALVERTVSHLRDVLAKTVTRGMDEVGQYLLKQFYDDDPELYFSASPNKHASLRLLIERCESMELPVRRTFIANALRMAAVTRALPRSASFHRLPPSHRVELLRVRVTEKVERLASKAVESNLSVQKLRLLVQKEQGRRDAATARGRKRTPELLKALERCVNALRDDDTGRLLFRRSEIDELSDEQLERGRTALSTLEKRVSELRRLMT